ncbi:hypothetical protein A1Q1_07439 [Trichosporon asahii var. asahii CBS 2479]|uniref:Uncharacterized protein n=1 Tax=Trichosporon asahii var. asahii (strain ATCC 90039 / CBS 2479 / JCM 2466 / KCTC 7840 / NBRC 103889/ NCYC 2677 / UAMH 7654) TaxID=1186058 RepID=J8TJ56_TRIAS|nr:hypothetical protein A1Q1_07439 [Trichosporon asahii var. asahii CBS 2479]EJT53201.1 hypothetical protein A1Q1_07439 [Trichosporon asahii var. asahii CBS 2479]
MPRCLAVSRASAKQAQSRTTNSATQPGHFAIPYLRELVMSQNPLMFRHQAEHKPASDSGERGCRATAGRCADRFQPKRKPSGRQERTREARSSWPGVSRKHGKRAPGLPLPTPGLPAPATFPLFALPPPSPSASSVHYKFCTSAQKGSRLIPPSSVPERFASKRFPLLLASHVPSAARAGLLAGRTQPSSLFPLAPSLLSRCLSAQSSLRTSLPTLALVSSF